MSNKEITTQTQGEFLQDFTEKVPKASHAILFASQLEITPNDKDGDLLIETLKTLIEGHEVGIDTKLIIDRHYVDNVTRVNIRDFPNWWPLLTKDERELRRTNAANTKVWLEKLENANVLQSFRPRTQSKTHSTKIREIASIHIAQHWALAHQKGGVILNSKEDSSFTLSTGNLTSSDIYLMNNFATRFTGERGQYMGKFISELMSPEAQLRSSGGHILETDSWVTLLHDYNNTGDPARLPFIHTVAEKLIDPKRDEYVSNGELITKEPETILYISQYSPDGKLAIMLDQAQKDGAEVIIPKQPSGDYREEAFPYNIQTKLSHIKRNKNILFPIREKPSHFKCLVVKYKDNTAAILFGSDNYLTHIQKFVRNEEISVLMKISPDSTEQLSTYNDFISKLFETKEINKQTYSHLEITT